MIEVELQSRDVKGLEALQEFSVLLSNNIVPPSGNEGETLSEGESKSIIIELHSIVETHSLNKKEYNRKMGYVFKYDPATERYGVKVEMNGDLKTLSLKG